MAALPSLAFSSLAGFTKLRLEVGLGLGTWHPFPHLYRREDAVRPGMVWEGPVPE